MHPIPPGFENALVTPESYKAMYAASIADPDAFWGEQGKTIDWIKPYTKVKNTNFNFGDVSIKWFEDGVLNVAANCVDRHLPTRGDQVAIIWEPDDPKTPAKHITYNELHEKVCRMANVLLSQGVMRGDRVVIYLPMIPEAAYAMLACARIGAIHSVVFGGFAPKELATRIDDAKPKLVLSASCGLEPGRVVAYKPMLDEAIKLAATKPETCIVLQRPQVAAELTAGRDHDWGELRAAALKAKKTADCVPVAATDPLYILYTSGSTGKPKGSFTAPAAISSMPR